MPKIDIEIKEADGTKIKCEAKGFFFLALNFNNRKNFLRKFIKEYGDEKK